jgi:hypothetical protein
VDAATAVMPIKAEMPATACSHDRKSRNAIIRRKTTKKERQQQYQQQKATLGKQSKAMKKTTAGLQGCKQQQKPCNSRVDSSKKKQH